LIESNWNETVQIRIGGKMREHEEEEDVKLL
jgi:hypothetical protein